ncbi:MAG: glycosyltransferase family 2 protein, partial [Pseudomonadota bacterium]
IVRTIVDDHDLLDLAIELVEQNVVINNGPDDSVTMPVKDGLTLISPGENLGVAEAINRGVELLVESGYDKALLMDQDSQIDDSLVTTLAHHLDEQERTGQAVAAIGPRIRDHDDQTPAPFIRFRLPFNQRLQQEQGVVSCDFLITSGCLINLTHWNDIGPMRTAWFIDNIDLEWCFRAHKRGFLVMGCFEATLDHRIGERERLFGLVSYRRHSPERLYTMMRNRVFLYRSGAPSAWIVQDALRALGKLGLFSLIAPRFQHIRQMLRGVRDGFRTRPLP